MAESDPVFEAPLAAYVPAREGLVRRFGRIALMASVPLVMIGGASIYYVANLRYITTDNAYVEQDKLSVSPLVSGEVSEVDVRENQQVKAGDVLFRIDPEPFKIALASADAQIAAAQVRVLGMRTDLASTGADIDGAQKDVSYYEAEFQRQDALMQQGFTTRAQLQEAQKNLDDARARLADSQATASKAEAALASAPGKPGVNPALLAAQVARQRAELDLERTVVRAPVSGQVSQSGRLVLGAYEMAGLPAVTVVATGSSWVEANFKETDLATMRVGQKARLTFDAYPGIELAGHVASIGAGTGSEFSVLPAQNANGNWVKVTQRVPVRIAIDQIPSRPLIAGLSTHVSIDTGR